MATYFIEPKKDKAKFNNNALFCVGTGRLNLALRHEYHKQLEMVQRDIGFSYIRGHGLFCDDMAVYNTYSDDGSRNPADHNKEEYNFSYIDMVFDDYLSMGIKPFVELGFMPRMMASGEQTIFWWKGNVTPPIDYDKWARLVTATIKHWIDRYGLEEVVTWPFEVWNEPNLAGFWKDADMDEYFKLYDVTAKAVKSCSKKIRVGGPAICGVDDERWLRCFLKHCRDSKAPIDFVTRHAYGTEMPEFDGHYVYQELRPPEVIIEEMNISRGIIDSFPEYKGMQMHITEFNSSYSPLNPIHDTNLNAAYVAALLAEFGDTCASYSYWTFGDVFEETGVGYTPFSGCFGLVANGLIPKPTYWTYVFYKDLFETAVARTKHFVITKNSSGDIHAVVWNLDLDNKKTLPLKLDINIGDGVYFMLYKTVDEAVCNPLKTWLDMGSPSYPSQAQLELLRESARPQIETKQSQAVNGTVSIDLKLLPNAVCCFELKRITPETDRGYKPERIPGAS